MRLFIKFLGNCAALWLANMYVGGFIFTGEFKEYLVAGLLVTIMYTVVRPVLKFFAMPLIILTLGLFTLVINAGILWLTDYLLDFVVITDLPALVWTTVIISFIGIITSIVSKK